MSTKPEAAKARRSRTTKKQSTTKRTAKRRSTATKAAAKKTTSKTKKLSTTNEAKKVTTKPKTARIDRSPANASLSNKQPKEIPLNTLYKNPAGSPFDLSVSASLMSPSSTSSTERSIVALARISGLLFVFAAGMFSLFYFGELSALLHQSSEMGSSLTSPAALIIALLAVGFSLIVIGFFLKQPKSMS